jgi:hypothetical protein
MPYFFSKETEGGGGFLKRILADTACPNRAAIKSEVINRYFFMAFGLLDIG